MNLERYSTETELPVSAETAFAWHERPGAFERLLPPWRRVRIVERAGGVRAGARTVVTFCVGGLPIQWRLEHRDCKPGRSFCDVQTAGPLRSYEHLHEFVPLGPERCLLRDTVSYALPFGGLIIAGWFRSELVHLFAYRHAVARGDLLLHARYAARPRLTVAVTGATGLLGSALCWLLTGGGHRVLRLVRHVPRAEDEIQWDPDRGVADAPRLNGIDAIVHLAGENIGAARWTARRLEQIRRSRINTTCALVSSLASCDPPPSCFVCASAVGIYGDRGEELLDERSAAGTGLLAELCKEWEAAAARAEALGMRAVSLRFGVVLTPAGGMIARLLPVFRLGLGGPVGSGRQYVSWVSLDDAIGAIHHVLMHEEISGPVNVAAPQPVRSSELAAELGRVLGRPAVVRVPAAILRLRFGRMADELLLSSARVVPSVLQHTGYEFRTPTLEAALRHMFGRTGAARPDTAAQDA